MNVRVICVHYITATYLFTLILAFTTVYCKQLFDPDNGNVTCLNNFSIYQDSCTYHCNCGYLLDGNSQTHCRPDGILSREPVTCNPLQYLSPDMEIANSRRIVGACNLTRHMVQIVQ